MTQAAFWDTQTDSVVEIELAAASLAELMERVLDQRSDRGHPALELRRVDGSSLSIGTDGRRAVVEWVNALGEPFQSVGGAFNGPVLIYDYMGSWSEAPDEALVRLEDAIACAEQFLQTGAPDTGRVLFTPT